MRFNQDLENPGPRRIHEESGTILVSVIWIMVVLSVLAVSLSWKTRMAISLSRYALAKLRADALVWSGLLYSLDQLRADTNDSQSSQSDTMLACGVRLEEGETPEDRFGQIFLSDDDRRTGYLQIGYSLRESAGESLSVMYGFADEERKINLNALTVRNDSILRHLLAVLGFPDAAEAIAASVIDWHDADDKPARSPVGSESEEYETLPVVYRLKNSPFENLEELLLVKGVSFEMYARLKEFTTIFPLKARDLKINLATAPEIVIRAVARSVAESTGNTDSADADDLAGKIVRHRRGPDGREGTLDDREIRLEELKLTARERSIFLMMGPLVTRVSEYFRVRIRGVEKTLGVVSTGEAVISREDLSVVLWRREVDE